MSSAAGSTVQFSTFWLEDRLYGINVMGVQEVTVSLPMTRVPLAPKYVFGLINLRGQISTAVDLRTLFGMEKSPSNTETMNVVCNSVDMLFSFLVDRIGDVIEVTDEQFETTPETIPYEIRRFMSGVYKIEGQILSVIEVSQIAQFISEINKQKEASI